MNSKVKQYEKMYAAALKIAVNAHSNQFDKGGVSYIFHPLKVAENCETMEEKIVAILHDVLEDSNITVNDLLKHGISNKIIDAVVVLTRMDHEDYEKYIRRIAAKKICTAVKIQDLKHNMDVSRLQKEITDTDIKRLKKYQKALFFLEERMFSYDK